jgi:hypothetical protein
VMRPYNPFPVYPVSRLSDEPDSAPGSTIVTDTILQSRRYVQDYALQWQEKISSGTQEVDVVPPLIVAVKGDFGTGKTHLLLDALAQVQRAFSSHYPNITMVRFPCVESAPGEWYRNRIGPALKPELGQGCYLRDTIIRLYARAGENVAGQAKMTASAVTTLREKPQSIYDMIKQNLLNVTAVDHEFQTLLGNVCTGIDGEVLQALSALPWEPTSEVAVRWLTGEQLSHAEAKMLRVEPSDLTSNRARDVLVALAAVHCYLNRPFGLLIDELEHLTRYDETHHNKANLTWLKRLLEGLGPYGSLVYIAGHWSAWETRLDERDFLSRFSYRSDIILTQLRAEDVLNVVRARVKDVSPERFGLPQAAAVVEFGGSGSIRSILSLLKSLFDASDGFRLHLSRERIGELALRSKQRVTLEDVELRVREFFESRGLTVEKDAAVARNVTFDLVASHERPEFVVEFEHAIDQLEQVRAAERFAEQMEEIRHDFPRITGCFVSDGNVDRETIAIFNSLPGSSILSFDLNEPDFMAKLAQALEPALEEAPKEVGDERTDHLNELWDRNLSAAKETLGALEQRRLSQHEEQQGWQEAFAGSLSSQRSTEIVAPTYEKEEMAARLHTTYAELTKPMNFSTRLRLALSPNTYLFLVLMFLGILALVVPPALLAIFEPFISPYFNAAVRLASYVVAGLCLLVVISSLVRRLFALDTFVDFSARVLREVYIRSASPQDLITVHNILRDSVEDYGPVVGRKAARERLAQVMPHYYFGEPYSEVYERLIQRTTNAPLPRSRGSATV